MKQIIPVIAIALIGAVSCNSTSSKEKVITVEEAQLHAIDSMKMEIAKQKVIDSMNNAAVIAGNAKPKVIHTTHTRTVYVNSNNPSQPVVQPAAVAQEETQSTKKKGWSAKAKGAVIGAGAGAITGAMISKQKGKGAIIGGVLGAGTGLGVGAIIDKKQGR
jgi:hypothetical protein